MEDTGAKANFTLALSLRVGVLTNTEGRGAGLEEGPFLILVGPGEEL